MGGDPLMHEHCHRFSSCWKVIRVSRFILELTRSPPVTDENRSSIFPHAKDTPRLVATLNAYVSDSTRMRNV